MSRQETTIEAVTAPRNNCALADGAAPAQASLRASGRRAGSGVCTPGLRLLTQNTPPRAPEIPLPAPAIPLDQGSCQKAWLCAIFVVDIALDSPLSRKQVDLMKRRVRQAGEDKVRRVLLKLTAQVGGKDRLSVTRGRIVGFKARKNAEFAGGALEETLVGDWPDVGFISLPPDERDGPGAREEPKPSATEPKGDAKPQKDASLEVGGKDEKNLNPKTNPLRSNE